MSSPVGVTAAEPGIRQEGPVTGALVQTGSSWSLTIGSSPANRAVTFSPNAHASSRTGGVHAVHCIRRGRGGQRREVQI